MAMMIAEIVAARTSSRMAYLPFAPTIAGCRGTRIDFGQNGRQFPAIPDMS
jgi:hypothetical protein